MKMIVYNCRPDESGFVEKFSQKYKVEFLTTVQSPTKETVPLAEGCECISMITTPMDETLMRDFQKEGIRYLSTRSIGYDHIDLSAAKKLGIHIGNVTYSPDSVADYTVMMVLMAIRRIKAILARSNIQDFSLVGIQGKELHNLTVGVVGTGRIGRTVLKRLSGFGCTLLAYDLYPNREAETYAKYVPVDELLKKSDVICLHMPATDQNYHFICRESIKKMKNGVFLINTARGSLINTADFMDAVESGKIGGAALDVIEQEEGLYYNNLKTDILDNRALAVLKSYPNVLLTPHTAFYTDQAVSDMVEHSIESCTLFSRGEDNPWQVV